MIAPYVKPTEEEIKKEREVGRPTNYSDHLAYKICELIANGTSLNDICKTDGYPGITTVIEWLAKSVIFSALYEKAREARAEKMVYETIDIADDGRNDFMQKLKDNGELTGIQLNAEHIQRSKLRIETRKWLASRFNRKMYGDHTVTELKGKVSLNDMSDDELDRKIRELQNNIAKVDD